MEESSCMPTRRQWCYSMPLRAHAKKFAGRRLAKGGGAVLVCAHKRPPSYRARPSTRPSVSKAASPPSSRSARLNNTSISLGQNSWAMRRAPCLRLAWRRLSQRSVPCQACAALPRSRHACDNCNPNIATPSALCVPTCQRIGVRLPVGRGGKQPSVGVEPSGHHTLQKLLHQAAHVDARLLHSAAWHSAASR